VDVPISGSSVPEKGTEGQEDLVRHLDSQVPEGEGPGPPAKGTGRAATKGGSLNCLIRLLLASQAVLQRLG